MNTTFGFGDMYLENFTASTPASASESIYENAIPKLPSWAWPISAIVNMF